MFIQHFNMKFFQLQQDLNKQILCHLLQSMYVVMSFRNLIYYKFFIIVFEKEIMCNIGLIGIYNGPLELLFHSAWRYLY